MHEINVVFKIIDIIKILNLLKDNLKRQMSNRTQKKKNSLLRKQQRDSVRA